MKKIFIYSAVILITGILIILIAPVGETVKHISQRESSYQKGPDSYPAEWAWLKRTFPHGKADHNVLDLARAQKRELALHKKGYQNAQWQFAGPSNVGGRVVDIEFDPHNPNIVYAAAASGGVFKSTDIGQSWLPVFDAQSVLTMGDLAIDPVNPQIIYAGTGEANGGHNNFPGGGIYKSTDGGSSWQFSGLENTVSIGRIVVDPWNNQRLWVAAVGSYFAPNPERGVYKSEDGGKIWEKSLSVSDSSGAIDLIIDPDNPDFLLAAMWERVRRPVSVSATHLFGPGSGIYRSTNGGKSWELLSTGNGLPDAQTEKVGRIGLAISRGIGKKIYALYNDGSNVTGIYVSENMGDSWIKITSASELDSGTGWFSWYFGQIRVSPDNPDKIWALDVSLMRSENGGISFPNKQGGSADLHVDHHAMAFMPGNSNYILSGHDGGISISQDGGDSWTKVANLPITQFYELGLDSTFSTRLYGGTQDNGSLGTTSGTVDSWQRFLGGDGFYCLVQPEDPLVLYAEWQFGGLTRMNLATGSNDFLPNRTMYGDDESSDPRNWSTPVVMDGQNHDILYYGTNRIWRSTNRGDTWYALSPVLTKQLEDSRVGTITTIAVAPSDTGIIYSGSDDGSVWLTQDNGENWTNITQDLPFRWITRIAIHPQNPDIAYITFSGLRWKDAQPHIFRTEDHGQSWQNISSNLPDMPLNALAIDPRNPQIIYCGGDIGAFFSRDEGQNWQLLGEGLPEVVVNDMKIHHESYELTVATHGRSMYTINLGELNRVEDERPLSAGFKLYQNYPNPFNPKTIINYELPTPGEVELIVYNTLGQMVKKIVLEKQNAGKYTLNFDASGLPSGIYFYKLKTASFVAVKQMLYLK